MAIASPGVVRNDIKSHVEANMTDQFHNVVFHDGIPNVVISQGFCGREETVLQVRLLAADGTSYSGSNKAFLRIDMFELVVLGGMGGEDNFESRAERYNSRIVELDLVAHNLWTTMQAGTFTTKRSKIGAIEPLNDVLADYSAYSISVEIRQVNDS